MPSSNSHEQSSATGASAADTPTERDPDTPPTTAIATPPSRSTPPEPTSALDRLPTTVFPTLTHYNISFRHQYLPLLTGVLLLVALGFYLIGALTFYLLGVAFFAVIYTQYGRRILAATHAVHTPDRRPSHTARVTDLVFTLSHDLQLQMPTVVFTTHLPGAAAFDFYQNQYLFVNPDLADHLSRDELTALLAHELYHLTESSGLMHLFVHTLHGLGYFVFALFFTSPVGHYLAHGGTPSVPAWLVYTACTTGYGLLLTTGANTVLREYEINADRYAAAITTPRTLGRALLKTLLFHGGQTTVHATSRLETLCRICFADHPSLTTRLNTLVTTTPPLQAAPTDATDETNPAHQPDATTECE